MLKQVKLLFSANVLPTGIII